jgi:hypothetical protein
MVSEIASNKRTHWRYAIVAIRVLRTLIMRDVPMTAPLIRLLLEMTHNDNSSVVSVLRSSPDFVSLTYSPTSALCKL